VVDTVVVGEVLVGSSVVELVSVEDIDIVVGSPTVIVDSLDASVSVSGIVVADPSPPHAAISPSTHGNRVRIVIVERRW
jgi:hypothetical protein